MNKFLIFSLLCFAGGVATAADEAAQDARITACEDAESSLSDITDYLYGKIQAVNATVTSLSHVFADHQTNETARNNAQDAATVALQARCTADEARIAALEAQIADLLSVE